MSENLIVTGRLVRLVSQRERLAFELKQTKEKIEAELITLGVGENNIECETQHGAFRFSTIRPKDTKWIRTSAIPALAQHIELKALGIGTNKKIKGTPNTAHGVKISDKVDTMINLIPAAKSVKNGASFLVMSTPYVKGTKIKELSK